MATIIDRSRLVVSVKNRADLTRRFPHDAPAKARESLAAGGQYPKCRGTRRD